MNHECAICTDPCEECGMTGGHHAHVCSKQTEAAA